MVHNETATGCLSPYRGNPPRPSIAQAIRRYFWWTPFRPLASADYRHDEWGVDVTVGGSQKGLMLPPGISFNALSDKAIAASKNSTLPKSFWSWDDMLNMNKIGFFPYTPATNMLQGLVVAIVCCTRRGSTTCLSGMPVSPKRRGAPCLGPSKSLCRDPK